MTPQSRCCGRASPSAAPTSACPPQPRARAPGQRTAGRSPDGIRQSLADEASTEAPEQVLYALEGLASVAASVAEDETAARLWGASEAVRESIGVTLGPAELALHERLVPESRTRLGGDRFAAAWTEGKAMPTELPSNSRSEPRSSGPTAPCRFRKTSADAQSAAAGASSCIDPADRLRRIIRRISD